MIRASMIFLVLLLLGAAAGRYSAEASVRDLRRDMQTIETKKAEARREIQTLRAEVAYLESPDRLQDIAAMATDLKPVASRQLLTSQDFAAAFAGAASEMALSAALDEEPRDAAHHGASDAPSIIASRRSRSAVMTVAAVPSAGASQ